MAELYIGNNQIGGGSSADLSNYYNKSEIDSSFGETYLVKISNAEGYFCYVPRTMSDADKATILSKLNTNGGITKTAASYSAFIGSNSNSEGFSTKASGNYSHAEGYNTTADGDYSHAEGSGTSASGNFSHAEGNGSATGTYSHAEGFITSASGDYSHAEGYFTNASGNYSHAEGYLTRAKLANQHAEGKYNSDASTAILIVGNGKNELNRHNALEVHLSGDVKISDTHAAGEAHQKPLFVLQDKLYQIDSSITALEANSGGGEGGGSGSVDLSSINSSINAIENNYVKSDDISTFITSSYTYDKAHIDASISALTSFVVMTESAYGQITPDANTIYFIIE